MNQEQMKILIDFPGRGCVGAYFDSFSVITDQPPPAGEGSFPTPFEIFLGSIGACAGATVLLFCQRCGLPIEGVRLIEQVKKDPETELVDQVFITIETPADFPGNYINALVLAAEQCAIKKQLEQPPRILISGSQHADS